jgi:hypothetical protein
MFLEYPIIVTDKESSKVVTLVSAGALAKMQI